MTIVPTRTRNLPGCTIAARADPGRSLRRCDARRASCAPRTPPTRSAAKRGETSGLPVAAVRQPQVGPGECSKGAEHGPPRRLDLLENQASRSRWWLSSSNWRRESATAKAPKGWVFHSLLSGRRTALVMPWEKRQENRCRCSTSPGPTRQRAIAARLRVRRPRATCWPATVPGAN